MGYVLTFDFETRDPSIAARRGAGWCFKDFEILGAAYKIDESETLFTTDMEQLRDIIRGSRTLIAHNAQYDVGCLHRLGIDYTKITIIDTMILAKLWNNSLMSYSLDSLGDNLLGERKDCAALKEVAEALGIKGNPMSKISELFLHSPELVARYARQDVELTYKLSQWFKRELYEDGLKLIPFYSDLIKGLVKWRSKGVRIDLAKAEKSDLELQHLHDKYMEEFQVYCPNVNIESTKQLSEAFRGLGLVPGVSAKGGDSVDSKWRATQTHPAVVALESAKKYNKLRREFVEGLVSRTEDGRIYPEINIMGAAETGRFSSSNPNVQQIPKRDPLATELIRGLFLPEEGEQIYDLDFSSQEPRLQVHYAYMSQCNSADLLRDSFLKNPQHDLHQQVADLAGITRTVAKTINLGLSYGMGAAKLAATLKLSTTEADLEALRNDFWFITRVESEWDSQESLIDRLPFKKFFEYRFAAEAEDIPANKARELIKKYRKSVPYLTQLNKHIQHAGIEGGYVKTVLGRRLKMDMDKPYKALNKLIQGGAADQTAAALVAAYRADLPILFSVHDEIVMSSSDPKDALKLKEIMETIIPMEVPCYTEIMYGPSWGSLSPLN